jgi:uncharacterized protein (TIGR00255 family)
MNSMTGFGSSTKAHKNTTIACEIRSVNHRFLSLRQSLPEGLTSLEPVIEQMVRKAIRRGAVNVALSVRSNGEGAPPAGLDLARVRALFSEVSKLKRSLGVKEPPRLEALLAIPALWQSPSGHASTPAPPLPAIESVVRGALSKVARARGREGAAVKRELTRLVDEIAAESKTLLDAAPAVREAYRKKIEDRMQQIVPGAGAEREAIYKEIASMLDKCDISEEVHRLAHHVREFRKALNAPGPIGRRLDFLSQEMLRETNTTAAKAGETTVIDATIRVKAALERIREQVENVE